MTLICQEKVQEDQTIISADNNCQIIAFELDGPPGTKFKCYGDDITDADADEIEVGTSGKVRIDNTMLDGITKIKIVKYIREVIVTYIQETKTIEEEIKEDES